MRVQHLSLVAAVLFLLCVAQPARAQTPVGQVQKQSGECMAYLGAFPHDLEPGENIFEDSTLVTGAFSKLQCVLANGLMVSMGASSFMTVGKVRLENGTATTQLFLGPGIFRLRTTNAVSANRVSLVTPNGELRGTGGEVGVSIWAARENDYDVLLEQLPNFEVVPVLLDVVGQSMKFGQELVVLSRGKGDPWVIGNAHEGVCVYYPQSVYQESGKPPVVGNASDLLRRWLARIELDDKAPLPSNYPGTRRKSARKSMDLMMKSNRQN